MSNTKVCTKCSLEKPLDAFHKDKYKKDGYRTDCKECFLAYRRRNKEAINAKNREYMKEYYHKNKEECLAKTREWKKNNRGRCSAIDAKRRAAKLNATPAWADQEKIDYVYYCRDVVNKVYGGDCQVDHIEPLQGEHVCGLHVHNNLQLLSAKANQSKGARRTE